MATIVFLLKELSLRGTSVASYDYAEGCETIINHRAVILFDPSALHDPLALDRFRSRFPLLPYQDAEDIDRVLERERVDLVHVLKGDGRDKWTARSAPTAVHQVFPAWPRDAHGSSYAYVSRWLARASAGSIAPWVPHIVSMPGPSGDLRSELSIPCDALVLGCHGGALSFDLVHAQRALARALSARRDLYFVGLNLTPFLAHERALFLPGTADPIEKRRFIDTCDAMLHARHRGETFGLAVAEFSICNRPVLTYKNSNERAHIEMLGDAAIPYASERDLLRRLLSLDKREIARRDWDRYSEAYSKAPVMQRFNDVFIRNPVDPGRIRAAWGFPEEFSFGGLSRFGRRIRRRWRGKSP